MTQAALLLLGLGCVSAFGATSRSVSASTPVCWSSGAETGELEAELVPMMTGTSADDAALRDSLDLPTLTTTDVIRITADSLCQVALTAYQTKLNKTMPDGKIAAYRVGSNYAVWHPNYLNGEFGYLAFFTNQWVFISATTM